MKFAVVDLDGTLRPIIGHTRDQWIVLQDGRSNTRTFNVAVAVGTEKWWRKLVIANAAEVHHDIQE